MKPKKQWFTVEERNDAGYWSEVYTAKTLSPCVRKMKRLRAGDSFGTFAIQAWGKADPKKYRHILNKINNPILI